MIQEQIRNELRSMSADELEAIKRMIEEEEESRYDEMWWTHTRKDDYIYIIHYKNGDYYLHHIASETYRKYLDDDNAEWIERRTKDLFPVYEFLERKTNEKGL